MYLFGEPIYLPLVYDYSNVLVCARNTYSTDIDQLVTAYHGGMGKDMINFLL